MDAGCDTLGVGKAGQEIWFHVADPDKAVSLQIEEKEEWDFSEGVPFSIYAFGQAEKIQLLVDGEAELYGYQRGRP